MFWGIVGAEVSCTSSKQLHREFNAAADKLANEDVSGFLEIMAPVVLEGQFVQLLKLATYSFPEVT